MGCRSQWPERPQSQPLLTPKENAMQLKLEDIKVKQATALIGAQHKLFD